MLMCYCRNTYLFYLKYIDDCFQLFYFGWRIFYGDTCFYITDNS